MDDLEAAMRGVLKWIQANPFILLFVLYVLMQLYNRSLPFPVVEGSKVKPIASMDDFNKLVAAVKKTGGILVVDYYATWCGPCRTAAPVYGEMSKVYKEEDVIFAKVNVDVARDVAQSHGISAMPTFKLFNGEGEEFESIRGWNESQLRQHIVKAINSK